MLYSAREIFFARRCTDHAIIPAMMFAIISQPLWRKNAACGLWSIVGIILEFSDAMDAGKYENISVQGSEFKNLKSKSFPRSNSASEIHSTAVCACAMSPGPKTTLGIPPADKIAASQKKWTPNGFDWPTHFINFWTSGNL